MDYVIKKDNVDVTIEEIKKTEEADRIKAYAEKLGVKLQKEENE